jgi:hypothetical protein
MPNSLQYPLERQRDLQRRWARLLQRTAASKPAFVAARINCSGTLAAVLVHTMPPRDPNDDDGVDDDDEDETEEDREPAVIREPDEDE